jgi:Arc/MetJ family transcription regulator
MRIDVVRACRVAGTLLLAWAAAVLSERVHVRLPWMIGLLSVFAPASVPPRASTELRPCETRGSGHRHGTRAVLHNGGAGRAIVAMAPVLLAGIVWVMFAGMPLLPSDTPCPWPFVANIAGQFDVGKAKICYPTHTWMWHQMMPNLMLIPDGKIMRTTINIDDALLTKAAKLVGPMDRTAMVSEGLKALIERESARRLARLGGTQPTLKAAPRRRLKSPV